MFLSNEKIHKNPFRVLLVDDELDQRSLQKEILSSADFIISEANDGRSALHDISNNQFDVILLDKNMPGIHGDDICKMIREKINDIFLPVIMVSGEISSEELAISLCAGATDYIRKPFEPTELLARVTRAAQHKRFLEQCENTSQKHKRQNNQAMINHHSQINEQENKKTNRKLSNCEFIAILETTTVGLFGLDIDGRVTFVNAAACNMLGYSRDELGGSIYHDIIHHSLANGQSYKVENCPIHHSLITGESTQGAELFFHKNGIGMQVCYSCVATLKNDQVNGVVVTFQDMTETMKSEKDLQLAATVFENSHEGMLVTDLNHKILKVNRAFSKITGYVEQDVIGQSQNLLRSDKHDAAFFKKINRSLRENGTWQGEVCNRKRNGKLFPALLSINSVKDALGNVSHYVSIFSDITAIKQSYKEIERIAHHDPLTGLPNRLLFKDRLMVAVNHARRGKYSLAILFIDLDRFKSINDSLGHSVGDQLLIEVAKRITSQIRAEDVVARLGGDEFVVLLGRIDSPEDAAIVSRKIMKRLKEPMILNDHTLFLTQSIGISLFPQDADDTDKLIRNADAAMYHVKEYGFNDFLFYDKKMTQKIEQQMVLEVTLRKAIELYQFELYYQPQFNLISGELSGTEALIRWNHPYQGIISPNQFILVAESSGLIVPIGEWVIHAACKQARIWLDQGIPFGCVSVNISSIQIQRDGLVDVVRSALHQSNLKPEFLELEITETAIMQNTDKTLNLLYEFKRLGVIISVDDFGTGYSSLSYLQNLPVDKLKIDRAFVCNLPDNQKDIVIAKTIIALGQGLGLIVIAEGIETRAQQNFLAEQGCEHGQGWLFDKAMTAAEFDAQYRTI